MRFAVSDQSKRRAYLLMILVGVLSMLLMPIDYRGGAAVSHPHATIQLIADLAGGSLDHHSAARTGHTHPAANSVWSPLGPLSAGLLSPNLPPDALPWSALPHTAAAISALSALASDALIPSPAFDAEQLTTWSSITGKYVLYALVLPPLMLLAWIARRGRFDRRTSRVLRGVPTTPEPPPPRPNGPFALFTP